MAVSHADPIKAAVAHYSGIHLDLFQRIVISPCSVTPLLLGAGSPIVLAVNSTGDDLDLAGAVLMGASFDLGEVDRFLTGAVGEPGRRVFYLQAIRGTQVVSLKLEKQQVALLAEHLSRLLITHPLPAVQPASAGDLVEPVLEEWVIGSLMVAINEPDERFVIIAEEIDARGSRRGRSRPARRARRGPVRADPRPDRGVRRERPRPRRRRPPDLPPVRRTDGPRGPRLPTLELRPTMPDELDDDAERVHEAVLDDESDWEDDELDDGTTSTSLDELLDSTLDVDDPEVMPLLRDGEIELIGRMPWSSNQTFLVHVRSDGPPHAGRLQARARRTSVVGLPARPVAARGRDVPARRAAGLASRAPDGHSPRRRALRRRIAAVPRASPTTPSTTSR